MGRASDTAGKGTGANRKSQLAAGTLAAATMVLAFAGAALTSTASGASAPRAHKTPVLVPARPATPAGEQFRGKVQTMLNGLRGVVIQMRANPATAKSLSSTGTNLLPMIAAAKQEVARLDRAELGQLRAGLSHDPNWQQAPSSLSAAVAAFDAPAASPLGNAAKGADLTASAATSGTGTFTDDCASAGDPYEGQIAVLVANEVQSGLVAAYFAVPGTVALFTGVAAPTGLRIAFAVAWGVANGVYLALAQTLAVAVDCKATAFANTQSSTLPVDPANSDTVVQASSQLSIDRLIAKAGNSQAKISAVQTTVQTVKTQTDSVDTAATALNNILNDITDRVDAVQSALQTLQANVDILQNTEVTILKKADTQIANLDTLQDLQVRMEIEQDLAKNGGAPLGIFQLPAAYGGYLEVVRSIVTDTLAKEAAIGNPTAKALTLLTAANDAFASGQYKAAYALYAKAYGFVR